MGEINMAQHKGISHSVAQKLSEFYFGDENGERFSKWLYSSSQAETELGNELYIDLAGCDFSSEDESRDAKQIIKKILGERLYKERAIDLARKMLCGEYEISAGCRKLADISMDTENIVPISFVGYASEFDRLGETDFYNDRIREDLEKLLQSLTRAAM